MNARPAGAADPQSRPPIALRVGQRHAVRVALGRALTLALACLPAVASPRVVRGQSPEREEVTVALVTAGPGAAPLEWLGHSALLVRGPTRGMATMVDYGALEGGPGAATRAAAGRLRAVVRVRDAKEVLAQFARRGRSVSVLDLRLTAEQVRALALLIEADVVSGGGRYVYRYDVDNCATRVRDHLDLVLGGALRRSGGGPAAGPTLRERGWRNVVAQSPAAALAGDLLMNDEIDRPASAWDLAAQPAGVEALVRAARTDSAGTAGPLAVEREVVRARWPMVPPEPRDARWPLAGLALALAAATVALARTRRSRLAVGGASALVAAVLGVPGLLLAAGAAFSEYTFARGNENLLLANPLTFAMLPLSLAYAAGCRRVDRWLRLGWRVLAALALAALALKLLPRFDQDNWRILALAVPLVCGMAVAVARAAPAPLAVPPSRRPAPAPRVSPPTPSYEVRP